MRHEDIQVEMVGDKENFLLTYVSENHKKLLSSVKAIGLESPKGSSVYHLGEQVRFSGWVLPLDTEVTVEWVVQSGDCIVASHHHTVRREDVLQRNAVSCHASAKHGFDFSLAIGVFDRVCLKLNEVEVQVWSVRPTGDPLARSFSPAARAFRDLHKRSGDECHPIGNVLDNNIRELLSSDFDVLSAREFFARYAVEVGAVPRAESAIKAFRAPDWPISFLAAGVEKAGEFSVPGVFSDRLVRCRFSVVIDDFNYLFFSNDDESFYLVQFCTNVCLVFPEHMIVVALSEVGPWVNMARDKLPELYRYVCEFSNVVTSKGNGNFFGLCLAQSRPYHYIYDYLFGLSLLLSRSNAKFDVYGVSGFDFFDVSFFENCNSYESLANEQLNRKCLSEVGFLVMPCVQYIYSDYDRGLAALSSKLIELSNDLCSSQFSALDVLDADLIIWIGVSNEKRSWIEQLEGFASIILELNRVCKKIGVLVDGRTFPLVPREADLANKVREDKLFDELVSRCPDVNFFNMIGLQPVEKIYLAQKVDFFISSYATDSIYPSAICGKPGVVYIAPSVGNQRSLHVHRNIIEVPSSKVKELLPAGGHKASWHETSISMDWRDVYECVMQLIRRENSK